MLCVSSMAGKSEEKPPKSCHGWFIARRVDCSIISVGSSFAVGGRKHIDKDTESIPQVSVIREGLDHHGVGSFVGFKVQNVKSNGVVDIANILFHDVFSKIGCRPDVAAEDAVKA